MGFEERITVDVSVLVNKIENRLDELKPFQYDSRYRTLLGEHFIKSMNSWERNIRSRKDDPFTLVVCGEFKRGKSSLINALLGEEVVTTNVTTETVTLNKISYGAHSNEAVLSGGRRLRLKDEDLERDNLEELIKEVGEPINQIEIKRPIEILKDVTIIDTPGLGDSLKDFSDLVDHALRQADAVIYVFSVSYPLSQAEQLFIKTEILPQRYTDLFLVGNYCDVLRDKNEYERMEQLLQQRVEGVLPGQKFWMVSALDELCIQLEEERPNRKLADLLADNFAQFRKQLGYLVESKREMVLPDRMQRLLKGMTIELEEQLQAMEEGLAMDAKGIQEAMSALEEHCAQQNEQQKKATEQIDAAIRGMMEEALGWIRELVDRMEKEVDSLHSVPHEDLKKYYSFYCMETLQNAINTCIEHHTIQLYEQLNKISADLVKSLPNASKPELYDFQFALSNMTWTNGDNFSYVCSMIPIGIIQSLSIVTDAIGGIWRDSELKKKVPDLLGNIREQFPDLRHSALCTVEDSYGRMGKSMKKQLDTYYNAQVEQAKIKVEQSAMVARQDAEKKEQIRAAIATIREVLAQMQN